MSAGVVADMVRRAAILVATVLAALTLSVDAVPDIPTLNVNSPVNGSEDTAIGLVISGVVTYSRKN